MTDTPIPSNDKLKDAPVCSLEDIVRYFVEEHPELQDRGDAGAFHALMTPKDFLEAIRVLGHYKLSQRGLRAYIDRLKLIPSPISRNGHGEYFVYPEHLDIAFLVLAMRRLNLLPLRTIRELLKMFPDYARPMVTAGRFKTDDLISLTKMLPKGYEVRDMVMAKACDTMLEDILPSARALTAATEPGNALQSVEEKLILARLDEIKGWVKSGRRQDYIRREAAQDLDDLAWYRLIGKKIAVKMMARQNRVFRKQFAREE